jgi:uncharacterized repeat protein (TIGR01451 family)
VFFGTVTPETPPQLSTPEVIVHVSVAPAAAQAPCVEVAETYVVPVGSGSLTFTPVAASGPLFVTVSVHVIGLPTVTGFGLPDFVIARSIDFGGDEDSASTCVAAPSIHVTKTADRTSVSAGDAVGFTVSVTNTGPGSAHGVTLSDPLPAGTASAWVIDAEALPPVVFVAAIVAVLLYVVHAAVEVVEVMCTDQLAPAGTVTG